MAKLSLRKVQPPGHQLELLDGTVLEVPGSVPVPAMLAFLNVQEEMKEAAAASEDEPDRYANAMEKMYRMVMDVLRSHNADMRDDLMLGVEDLMLVWGLIVSGEAPQTYEEAQALSVEEVVAEQITPEDVAEAEAEEEAPPTTPVPTRSRKRSPAPS